MGEKLTNNLTELSDSVKQYFHVKIDLIKLLLLRKISKSLSFVFELLIITLLLMLFAAFAATAFILWYGLTYNDYLTGVLIAAGFMLFLLVVFLMIRKKLFGSVFLSKISNIIFEEDED